MADPSSSLTRGGRARVLAAAFLGWMFAGVEMSLMIPATRPAVQEFLATGHTDDPVGEGAGGVTAAIEISADRWLSWYLTSFFLGAALGGAVFGAVGDRYGRVKGMGLSILCYSIFTGLSYFVTGPEQLLVLRFVACLGIGGMWPTGVALLSESWPRVSRPVIAGLIGTSANVGFLILGLLMMVQPVTKESWRWVLLLGASPVVLGLAVLAFVPESPLWTAHGRARDRFWGAKSPVDTPNARHNTSDRRMNLGFRMRVLQSFHPVHQQLHLNVDGLSLCFELLMMGVSLLLDLSEFKIRPRKLGLQFGESKLLHVIDVQFLSFLEQGNLLLGLCELHSSLDVLAWIAIWRTILRSRKHLQCFA